MQDLLPNHTWKSFENNHISHSVAHYLMAVEQINVNSANSCKAANIARHLKISRNAVSLKLRVMHEQKLLDVSEDKKISLTKIGRQKVNEIISTRNAIKIFLIEFLHLEPDLAEQESCKVEHLLGEQTRDELIKLSHFIKHNSNEVKDFFNKLTHFKYNCFGKTNSCEVCYTKCLNPNKRH